VIPCCIFPEVEFSEWFLGAKARVDSWTAYAAQQAFRWARKILIESEARAKDQGQSRRQERKSKL